MSSGIVTPPFFLCSMSVQKLFDYKVITAVVLITRIILTLKEWSFFAITDGTDSFAIDTQINHVSFGVDGAPFTQRQIVLVGAAGVAITFDHNRF